MPLLLARIDDRLVHAQVLVGCCEPLEIERLLVCDDEIAGEPAEIGLFSAEIAAGMRAEFLGVREMARELRSLADVQDARNTMLVVRDARTMEALLEAGAPVERVAVGGSHAGDGSLEIAAGVLLDPLDARALLRLVDRGVEVVVQRVARSRSTPLDVGALRGLLADLRD